MLMTVVKLVMLASMVSIAWLVATGLMGLFVVGSLMASYHTDEPPKGEARKRRLGPFRPVRRPLERFHAPQMNRPVHS